MKALILAAVLTSGIAAAQTAVHAPLSSVERSALAMELAGIKPDDIRIACAGPWCRSLANDVAAVFHGLKWDVVRINHGGLGIDGILGIRVNACGFDIEKLTSSMARALPRRLVHFIDDGVCAEGGHELFVIIGTPR